MIVGITFSVLLLAMITATMYLSYKDLKQDN
jgi:hypothetical protein